VFSINIAKKTLWICIGLLLFGSIFAIAFIPQVKNVVADVVEEFTDEKIYDKYTETITITDGILFGETLAKHKLTYNTYQCLTNCYATGETILYQDAQLFSDLNFKDKQGENAQIESSIILLQKEEKYGVEVDELQTECNEIYDPINETLYNVCEEIKTGSHIEEKTRNWFEEYNGDILEAGTYIWKIKGNKQRNQDVDWIVTSFEKELTEWAWWNANWALRKSVVIDANETYTDEPLLIKVDGLTLDTNNCSKELAFTDENDIQIPKKTVWQDLGNSECWAYIPVNHSNSGNETYYVYYSNAGANEQDANLTIWDKDEGGQFIDPNDDASYAWTLGAPASTTYWNISEEITGYGGYPRLITKGTDATDFPAYNYYMNDTETPFTYEIIMNVTGTTLDTHISVASTFYAFCAVGMNDTGIFLDNSASVCLPVSNYNAGEIANWNPSTPTTIRVMSGVENDNRTFFMWKDPSQGGGEEEIYVTTNGAGEGYATEYAQSSFTIARHGDGDPTLEIMAIFFARSQKNPIKSYTVGAEESANTAPIVDTPTILPSTAYHFSTLNCSTTPYDVDLDTLSVNFTWYNGSTFYEDNVITGLSNGTMTEDLLTSAIQYDAETWNCTVIANDGTVDSLWNSTTITMKSRPTQTTPYLNTTNGLNGTNANLTCWNQTTADVDGDTVKNIYNWYKDSTAIINLNMPFETNGSETTYAKDYSGYNYTGLVEGATFNSTGGYDGRGAYEFDGAGDSISMGDNLDIGTEDLSLFAWIKTSTTGTSQFIVGKRDVDIAINKGYEIHINTTDEIFCSVGDGQRVRFGSANTVTDGVWHHLGCTFDRDGNGQVYIDGVADGSAVDITDADGDLGNSDNLTIGAMPNSVAPKYFFNGSIDEVMIFDRVLSAEQVNALYNNNTNFIVSNETSEGDVWKCDIIPNDNELDGIRLESNSLTIETYNPSVITIEIDPSSAYTNSTINGTFVVNDLNDATVTAYCDWFNGTALYSAHSKSVSINTEYNFSLAPAGVQFKDETWNFTCNATDGAGWSAFNSTTVTIINTPPSKPTIGDPINESRHTGNSVTLNCDGSIDLDGDEIKYEFYGDENNPPTTLLQNTTGTSYDLTTIDGGIYWWRCIAGDNENVSSYTQIKQFVENNISVVTNITIFPTISYSNSSLIGYSQVYDSEDTLTVYMNWTNGSTHYSSCTETSVASGSIENCALTAGKQYKDEVWNFSSRIWDGYELSEFNSTTITIINTLPTIDASPILTPATVYTNTSVFNCSTIAYDVDLDPITINITWYVNETIPFNSTNITTTNGTIASFALDPALSQTAPETWNCSARAFDETDYSLTQPSATKTITNTAPSKPTQNSPLNNTVIIGDSVILNCSGSVDIDGDSIKYEFYGDTSYPPTTLLQNTTTKWYNFSGLIPETYYWRCATNDNKISSAPTNIWLFGNIEGGVEINETCPVGLTEVMYFDFKEENNATNIYNVTIDYNLKFNLGGEGNSTTFGNYSTIHGTELDHFSVCINASISSAYEVVYGEIQYQKSEFAPRRFYLFEGERLSIPKTEETLFLLPNSQATSFLFEFSSTGLTPYENYYTSLLRWYPELDTYDTVDMGKTDNKGQTIMRVKVEDVDYRVGLYNVDGTLVKLLDPVRFACLESPCSYSAIIKEVPLEYDEFLNIETDLIWETDTFYLTYNDPSQHTGNMSLEIYKETGTSSLLLCTDSSTGYTGVLSCNVSTYSGTLKAVAYRTASPEIPIAQKIINTASTVFKSSTGLFISLLICLVLIFIGASYGTVPALMGAVIGLIPALILGSITLEILIGLGTLIGIAIHFMKRV